MYFSPRSKAIIPPWFWNDSSVQVDVWRAMLAYPTTKSPEVRQMLRNALK